MTQIIPSCLISICTFLILSTAHVDPGRAQTGSSSGSPSPNVPKESGLQSKEGETRQKHQSKGMSGEEQSQSKGKKSSEQQQDEQMEHKHSGK
jgi:cell division protein FtsN